LFLWFGEILLPLLTSLIDVPYKQKFTENPQASCLCWLLLSTDVEAVSLKHKHIAEKEAKIAIQLCFQYLYFQFNSV